MIDFKYTLRHFLDADGALTVFPAKRKMKICALFYLAEKFEAGRSYTEREINEVLSAWHTFTDPATLRRELYDYRFLDRSTDGRVYRLSATLPKPEDLGL